MSAQLRGHCITDGMDVAAGWAACAPLNTGTYTGTMVTPHRHQWHMVTTDALLLTGAVSGCRITSGSHGNIDNLIMASIRHRMQLSVFCVYFNFIGEIAGISDFQS